METMAKSCQTGEECILVRIKKKIAGYMWGMSDPMCMIFRARAAVGLLFLLFVGFVLTVCVMPHIPRWLWQSKNPDLQEMAIPLLMRQIKVGMRPDEVVRLFGETNAFLNVQNDGHGCLSYNVDSWYNTGIDIGFTNGVVSNVYEFN